MATCGIEQTAKILVYMQVQSLRQMLAALAKSRFLPQLRLAKNYKMYVPRHETGGQNKTPPFSDNSIRRMCFWVFDRLRVHNILLLVRKVGSRSVARRSLPLYVQDDYKVLRAIRRACDDFDGLDYSIDYSFCLDDEEKMRNVEPWLNIEKHNPQARTHFASCLVIGCRCRHAQSIQFYFTQFYFILPLRFRR
jgi:hypothetical protein